VVSSGHRSLHGSVGTTVSIVLQLFSGTSTCQREAAQARSSSGPGMQQRLMRQQYWREKLSTTLQKINSTWSSPHGPVRMVFGSLRIREIFSIRRFSQFFVDSPAHSPLAVPGSRRLYTGLLSGLHEVGEEVLLHSRLCGPVSWFLGVRRTHLA
jgi:hypothetical protein